MVSAPHAGIRAAGSLPLFACTIFLSAWLLFQVQPMFAKMALPLLGGTPIVWNTALVFFQTALFLGYLYAHVLGKHAGFVWQVAIHLGLIALAFVALPVAIGAGWTNPPEEMPIPWLIALLTVSVGLPFFAISANAPLLQNWFARTGHAGARDPYFLYAASNLGSILALLAYPFLLEPHLRLAEQSRWWTGGFVVLAALIAACALYVLRRGPAAAPSAGAAREAPAPIGWSRRLYWLALAFVPSGLLVAATNFMTTDVAAIPLLWIVPLTLYLLSFVFVFARKPRLAGRATARVQAGLICVAAIVSAGVSSGTLGGATFLVLGVVLATLFATALVCHGELARRRPAASGLTDFYVWMSLGGILGSAFCALLAPLLFDRILEFAILLVMAGLLRPPPSEASAVQPARPVYASAFALREAGIPVAAAIALGLLAGFDSAGDVVAGATVLLAILVAVVALAANHRPLRFALCIAVLVGVGTTLASKSGEVRAMHSERSYFGTHRVLEVERGRFVSLVHGSTVHGVQATDPAQRRQILGYFHADAGIGRMFRALEHAQRPLREVAVVGMGAGTLACYRRDGQRWTFFEIDPAVIRIATNPRWFHFIKDCAPDARLAVGDGRLLLAREPDGRYDLLVADAFSSDSIPVHLYTREAVSLYFRKLTPEGLLLLNVTNRYLNVEPALAALVRDAGLRARIFRAAPRADAVVPAMWFTATWVAIARSEETLAPLTDGFDAAQPGAWGRWRPLAERKGVRAWTDDYSNLIDVIR